MEKYSGLRSRLVEDGILSPSDLHVPSPASDEDLLRVHTPAYVEAVVSGSLSSGEQRRIGFPWSPELVERSRRSVGGTIAACRQALQDGVSVNLAGGTHHAFADGGEGFCVWNDAAVAARLMQHEHGVHRVLIVDCDVHQGNGTAAIFGHDASVSTYSIHGANNYPFRKQKSNVDVAMADDTGDVEYLQALDRSLSDTLSSQPFDLAIYISGADPFHDDKLGRLALTKPGLVSRDTFVFRSLRDHGIPVAAVMAGGYARRVTDTVDIHVATVRVAADCWVSEQNATEIGFRTALEA